MFSSGTELREWVEGGENARRALVDVRLAFATRGWRGCENWTKVPRRQRGRCQMRDACQLRATHVSHLAPPLCLLRTLVQFSHPRHPRALLPAAAILSRRPLSPSHRHSLAAVVPGPTAPLRALGATPSLSSRPRECRRRRTFPKLSRRRPRPRGAAPSHRRPQRHPEPFPELPGPAAPSTTAVLALAPSTVAVGELSPFSKMMFSNTVVIFLGKR
jgi:hypothetical protein